MKRILITGGAGFIGSRLAAYLNADGHAVTIFDNLIRQVHGKNSADSELLSIAREAGEVVVGDITDREALKAVLAGQDIVLHVMWIAIVCG